MPSKKLFLLDAFALIYRAHFAFIKNPRMTSTGMNTSAVFGFVNTLLEVLKKENPSHLAVCFDTKAKTFRTEQFEAYKANRPPQPEDITIAIPYVKKMVKAMNIPCIELDGFEADDVIGTLAKKAVQHDFEVYMYTPDKDYGQLVEDHIFLYKPAFMGNAIEVQGVPEILEKWKIERIDQVIDMLGLMGDAVDNIPGIPGVGKKTAQKLLGLYGSVEGIIENAHQVKGKMGEKIAENAEMGIMSKQLATIDINVPVEFNEEDLTMCPVDEVALEALLDELEFRTLKRRMLPGLASANTQAAAPKKAKKAASTSQFSLFESSSTSNTNFTAEELDIEIPLDKRNIKNTVHNYHLIDTPEKRVELIKYLLHQKEICFDTETTDLDTTDAELVGIAFAYVEKEAYYVPVPAERESAQEIVEEFRQVFENETIVKIGQNLKYDISVLKNYDIEVKGELYDTMLAHYLIEPEKRHGMDYLADSYLNYEAVGIEDLIGKKGKKQGSMRDVAPEVVAEYAGEDADITLQLKHILDVKLKELNHDKLLKEVEIPLVKVLSDMEMEGVNIDETVLTEMSATLNEDLLKVQDEIYEIAGVEFNINSPKQLGEIMFEKLKIDTKPKKTPSGQYATGEEILNKYDGEHPIASKILDFRELSKLKSTYVDALPLLVNSKTGRIHTSYNQAVTATGRLSSTNPNLQNIPIRTERGREIRKAFIARDKDHVLIAADYSQIELRIMAAFSGDESMIEAFNQGIDIHSQTASKVFGVALEDVDSDMRRNAKAVNFGIIYGISAFGLAKNIKTSRTEAQEIIDAYFKEFPKVKTFMDDCINKAREDEYVETILGRRRYLPDINSRNPTQRGYAERNAINAPIQGSAADMIKVAMINIHQWLKDEKLETKMILQVHDELIFDTPKSELDKVKKHVNDLMINAIPFAVKIETGIGEGDNWLEAH
ncbi:MAG: DNA polymerase-1 [Spirosomataceae bacterium]|jgi:DNA polymerase-1